MQLGRPIHEEDFPFNDEDEDVSPARKAHNASKSTAQGKKVKLAKKGSKGNNSTLMGDKVGRESYAWSM